MIFIDILARIIKTKHVRWVVCFEVLAIRDTITAWKANNKVRINFQRVCIVSIRRLRNVPRYITLFVNWCSSDGTEPVKALSAEEEMRNDAVRCKKRILAILVEWTRKDLPKVKRVMSVSNPSSEGMGPVKAFSSKIQEIIHASECIFVAQIKQVVEWQERTYSRQDESFLWAIQTGKVSDPSRRFWLESKRSCRQSECIFGVQIKQVERQERTYRRRAKSALWAILARKVSDLSMR
jgi:hypothetical protein